MTKNSKQASKVLTLDHYHNQKLVEVYDTVNPIAADTRFYTNLVQELNPNKVVDVGCGTGLLTSQLTANNREIIGIEPAKLMLDQAKKNYAHLNISWIQGTTSDVKTQCKNTDLVIMTGHVSQVFITEKAWSQVLQDVHRFLKPQARLVFEMRNPQVKPWSAWNKSQSSRTLKDPVHGTIETYVQTQTIDIQNNIVDYLGVCHVEGQKIQYKDQLKFRNLKQLQDSLQAEGFQIEKVYGYWDKSQFQPSQSPEIIVEAIKK